MCTDEIQHNISLPGMCLGSGRCSGVETGVETVVDKGRIGCCGNTYPTGRTGAEIKRIT